MARPEIEEFQLYFNRLRPIYHQLFNLAHAITGNCDQAEYCLQYAMLDCWSAGDVSASHHGFREGLRSSVVRAALRLAASGDAQGAEFDWDGLQADGGDAPPLQRLIAQEAPETRRALALRYGCGLSPRRIARLLGGESARVQTLLRRFGARTRRRLGVANMRRCERMITQAVRAQLAQPAPLAPDMGGVFRTFQADAASASRPSRLPARVLHAVLAAVLALFCIAAFWFAAVLMQPTALEAPATPGSVETIAE